MTLYGWNKGVEEEDDMMHYLKSALFEIDLYMN